MNKNYYTDMNQYLSDYPNAIEWKDFILKNYGLPNLLIHIRRDRSSCLPGNYAICRYVDRKTEKVVLINDGDDCYREKFVNDIKEAKQVLKDLKDRSPFYNWGDFEDIGFVHG